MPTKTSKQMIQILNDNELRKKPNYEDIMGEVISPKQLIRMPPRDYTELSNDPRSAQFRDNFDYSEQKDFENVQRAKMQQDQLSRSARGSGMSVSELRAFTSRPMSVSSLHVPSNVPVHHMSDAASARHMSDVGGANDANGDGAPMEDDYYAARQQEHQMEMDRIEERKRQNGDRAMAMASAAAAHPVPPAVAAVMKKTETQLSEATRKNR